MSMFDISPEFAEQLGAYIEGNLSYEDTCQMEQMISANDELNNFVNELHDDNFTSLGDFATYDYFNLDTNFALPEIPDYTFGTGSGIFADVPDVFENSPLSDNLVNEDSEDLEEGLNEDISLGNMDVDASEWNSGMSIEEIDGYYDEDNL